MESGKSPPYIKLFGVGLMRSDLTSWKKEWAIQNASGTHKEHKGYLHSFYVFASVDILT